MRLLATTLLALIVAVGLPVAARELRVTEEEIYCLALNDYYEARGEPIEGRVAVAYVVLNRLRANWQGVTTVCETISFTANGRCAFSWVCDRYPILEPESWAASEAFANQFLRLRQWGRDPTDGALQYHEYRITPYWAKMYDFNIVIGDHVFYPKQVASKKE
jgi:N-acetylmuramoyl-L-alanine amidase